MTENTLIVDALSAGKGTRRSSRDSIGCGPRAVAGVFESEGENCKIARVESIFQSPSSLRKYDHLAVSAMTMDYSAVKQLISLWRKSKPRGRVLLGGPMASEPERILKSLRPDVLVMGEGEATLHDIISRGYLTERVSLSDIRSIGFLHNNEPIITESRDHLDQGKLWSKYPPSTTRIIDYPVYEASKIYVEVVRGCSNFRRTSIPLPDGRACSDCGICESEDLESRLQCPESIHPGCGFCSVPSVWGSPRSRPIDSIVTEITELLELGAHRIVLEAPDFLDYMRGSYPMTNPCSPDANIEAISTLIEKIMEIPMMAEGSAHLSIENMKACLFTEHVAHVLSRLLQSTSPNIGFETGSESHFNAIGKCGNPTDIVRAVSLAKKHGMTPFVYFIYGLPGEDETTVEESAKAMNLVAEAGAERIILYGFSPLPNSAFAQFPSSSARDPLSERLRSEASRINRDRKVDYIGRVIRGIAAEPSWNRHGFTMVYPLNEGPLMTVEGGYSAGSMLEVEIIEVLSPGLLNGRVVDNQN